MNPAPSSSTSPSPLSPLLQSRVIDSESTLSRLLSSWRSRYDWIILFQTANQRVVTFMTEWSRHPTPHQPLTDIRVHVHFAFLYDTKYNGIGEKVTLPPTLTFRIEHEQLIHRVDLANASGKNIDHHILRHLKFKTEFHRHHPLPLTADQSQYFSSRFDYQPLDKIEDTHLGSFLEFANDQLINSLASDDRQVER